MTTIEGAGAARTTVVIATRNRRSELVNTIHRLLDLSPAPPVIVVDNASTDDTAAAVQQFVGDGVQLIRLRRNIAAAARNVGVAAAKTPYVAFSDDDSWWAAGSLNRAESVMDSHPRLGLIAATTLVGTQQRVDPIVSAMADSPLGHRAGLPGPSVLGFLACSAIVRCRAFRQVGGFSPLLHFGAEETLLAYDLAARGWQQCFVADVVAHHHSSPRRLHPDQRRCLELRNNALIVWLRRPRAACVSMTATLLRQAVRDPIATAAIAGALRRLPAVLAGRRGLPGDVEAQIGRLESARALR
jgi:glycosyltransferase involved in cell wall biosynthesis